MAQINTYSPDGLSRACVQYDRNGGVTVGLQRARANPALMPDDSPIVIDGMQVVNHLFDDLTGMWSGFDRGGINNLIRSLREARDKAFGKDE